MRWVAWGMRESPSTASRPAVGEEVDLAAGDAFEHGQPAGAEPARHRPLEGAMEQAVGGELDHGGETDAVRSQHGDRPARIADGRHSVALAIASLQLAAVAAESDEHSRTGGYRHTSPVVAIEERRCRPAVEPLGVGVSQVEGERLPLAQVIERLFA